MTVNDPFVTYDAAYVLGALSPEERAEYEKHLRDCDACASAVRELAGMPGLLAQVDPPVSGFPVPGPPPPELLPDVLRRVRRGRRLRNAITATSAAVAVAACVALAVVAALPPPAAPGPAPAPPSTAMTVLGQFPVQADARLVAQEWGTQVDMSCSYEAESREENHGGRDYVLVAIGRDGAVTQLATWLALPSNTARIVVGTTLKTGDLRALEIRSVKGIPLLRLTL